jgi:hypothetical protein
MGAMQQIMLALGGTANDPHFSSVTLLCHFDGTNGSTSFTDSSASGHTLTSANGANVTTSSPKFGTGSGDFTIATSNVINITGTVSDF